MIQTHGRLSQLLVIASALLVVMTLLGHTAIQAKEDREPPVPLAGLSTEDRAGFEEGRKLFELPFAPREGLGPVFNARACAACHHIPTIGGHGPGYRGNIRYTESEQGPAGKLFHDRSIAGGPAEALPANALLSKRRPPTLLGLGLVEAIPEEAILARADPDDRDGDGIRGRPALRDGHLLRFGSQSHVGSLFEFVADALRQEMGLTSPLPGFDREPGRLELPAFGQKQIPEPNVPVDAIRKIVDFVARLAPPPRDTSLIGDAQVARGERLFRELDCAKCHVPAFRTSSSPFTRQGDGATVAVPALLGQEIAPYSDFLLHDLGPTLNDGITLGVAKSSEYRTPPLWGLRFHKNLLLHDGRANSPEQAILYHGGEAARSRNRFLSLPAEDRQALIEFLKTL
ncbi:MAG: di-heme oxidoredictase family protein [Nitrospiraceae bacterium]